MIITKVLWSHFVLTISFSFLPFSLWVVFHSVTSCDERYSPIPDEMNRSELFLREGNRPPGTKDLRESPRRVDQEGLPPGTSTPDLVLGRQRVKRYWLTDSSHPLTISVFFDRRWNPGDTQDFKLWQILLR